jgi:hypothetical protein
MFRVIIIVGYLLLRLGWRVVGEGVSRDVAHFISCSEALPVHCLITLVDSFYFGRRLVSQALGGTHWGFEHGLPAVRADLGQHILTRHLLLLRIDLGHVILVHP